MDESKGSARVLIVSLFIISQCMIIYTAGDGGGAGVDDQGPNPVERGINYKTPFEKLTSLIKLAWDNIIIHPDSERNKEGGSINPGEHIRNAAVESFEVSKEAAERSAKAAGDAAHEAAEKIKRTVLEHDGQPDEF